MRILFWGTPDFAVPSLDALLRSEYRVVGLVTQPDRPRGRSGSPGPPPTKERLLESGVAVPVFQPEKPAGRDLRLRLSELSPDVNVVAAYGNLLPGRVLELPRFGSLNVHASLLPRHRGAAPVAAAILAGDPVTGITLMRMDRGLDTGPVLLQRSLEIGAKESCGALTARLADLGAEVLLEGLALLEAGRLEETPQREEGASYAPRVSPEQARIRWEEGAERIERTLRAYDPWPGAHTRWGDRRLKVFRGRVADPAEVPGDLLRVEPGAVAVVQRAGSGGRGAALYARTGDGALELQELQLEGRPRMSAAELLKGRSVASGTRFT